MTAPHSHPIFRRLFPPHEWRRRRGLGIILWSVLSALCLVTAILASSLVVDLLVGGGRLVATANEVAELQPLVAGTRHDLVDGAEVDVVQLTDTGLLPTLWRVRDRWWAAPLPRLYRRVSWLQTNSRAMLALAAVFLVAGLGRVFFVSHVRMLASRLSMESASSLRRSIHRQALRLGPSDLDGAEQRNALELFTTASGAARHALSRWLSGIIRLPLEFGLLLAIVFLTDWRLGLQCGIPLALIGWVTFDERRRGLEVRRRADSEAESDLRPLAEGLRKTRLVRGYGMEEFEHRQFQTHLERYTSRMLRGRMGESWSLRTARFFSVLLFVVMLLVLGMRMLSTEAPLAAAGAWLILVSLSALAVVVVALKSMREQREQATVSADRIFRYLAAVPEVSQAVGAKFLNPVSQSIILEAVTYRRGDQTLLDRADLRIPAKSTVALVSNEPLTARSIAFMLPRFIEPHSGRILFDSEDIAWATLESLRAETIYVSADDPFFTGTVIENLICGEARFSTQEAMDACKTTHAHKFITALPNGYETQLGEHGEQLSPGQSFRLGLARAVLRNPAVMIIEEPRTRLDDDSKALVDDAYVRVLKDRTVLFLPTRLSTVKLCQQVVFLAQGQIETVGTHAELVKKCEGYRHWEYVNFSQLSRAKS